MSALQGSKDNGEGWIEWGGGECPVEGVVQIRLREHDNLIHLFIDDKGEAEDWSWRHDQSGDDIIAYRIHKES